MTDDGHLFTQSVMFFAKRRTNCIIPPSGQNNDCTLFRQAAAVRLFREAAISVISQNSYRHFAKRRPPRYFAKRRTTKSPSLPSKGAKGILERTPAENRTQIYALGEHCSIH